MASLNEDLKKVLEEIIANVETDSTLTDELRDKLTELATAVMVDPTPDNLKALAIVLETLGNSERYLNALAIVQGAM